MKGALNFNIKICPGCTSPKSLEEFHRSKNAKQGRDTYCKNCAKKRKRKNHIKHKESDNLRSKEYGGKNKEIIKERKKIKHTENRGENLRRSQIWSDKNREKLGDSYIIDLLIKKSSLCRADIPQELIEFKREHLRLKREIRNYK